MQKILLLLLVTFISTTTKAQKIDWKQVDKDISNKRFLADLFLTLDAEKNIALNKKDYGFVGRCYDAQLRINDLRKEDTSYFKNSSFIDSILNSNAAPMLQAVMHVMQGKRLSNFERKFYYRNNKNLFKNNNGIAYNELDLEKLDSIINSHFKKALQFVKTIEIKNDIDYLWLSSDALQFFFKPKMIDIIIAEQIAFSVGRINKYTTYQNEFLLKTNASSFFNQIDSGKNNEIVSTLTLYKTWADYNSQNKSAYYFIETMARKFIFSLTSKSKKDINDYQNYLKNCLESECNTVKANAVYQRCMYLYAEGNKYKSEYQGFDTAQRFKKKEAILLFEQHQNMLDSFKYVKDILMRMKEEIMSTTVSFNSKQKFIPNTKINLVTTFRNTDKIFVKILKANALDEIIYKNDDLFTSSLKKLAEVKKVILKLPSTDDHQNHKATLTIDGLNVGCYYILYDIKPINDTSKLENFLRITVSNIAVINNDSKVFVLDRTSGFPLKDAKLISSFKNNLNVNVSTTYKVNKDGYAEVKGKSDKLITIYKGDTLTDYMNGNNNYASDNIYDGEDDEDLVDFYMDNMQLDMFTDRSIYRPGQTVHYKGIITVTNPKNGYRLVLNKQNLALPFYVKLMARFMDNELSDLLQKKSELYIVNPFNKKVDTIKMKLNEFGTFAGSYKIPDDAATGEWEFEADEIDEIRNNRSFKVEEYKRPTFELSFIKPDDNITLGDDFTAKIKVKSFAGAALTNTKIKYSLRVGLSYDVLTDTLKNLYNSRYKDSTIVDTTANTNSDGVLEIKVKNNFVRSKKIKTDKRNTAYYNIEAEAIDATGESHDIKERFEVSNRPIAIKIKTSNSIEKSEINPIKIGTAETFTGKSIDKKVKIKLYKIIPAKYSTINTSEDFIQVNNDWKYNEFKSETIPSADSLIEVKEINGNTDTYLLPKEKLQAGKYKIVTTCEEKDITLGETTREFTILDKDGALQNDEDEDYYYLKNNYAAANQRLDWFVGNKANKIFSIYHAAYYKKTKNGYRLKNDYSFKTQNKTVEKFTYAIPNNTADKVVLTHVYVLNGEINKKEENIYINKETKATEIIVEKYRKILVPGQKEIFAVTVKTKNENIAAEVLTTMYDASLDKIEKHRWQIPRAENNFYINNRWNSTLEGNTSSQISTKWNDVDYFNNVGRNVQPLYWLNPMDYAYSDIDKKTISYDEDGNALMGRVSGVTITGNSGFDEVVVVGYGTQRKMDMTGTSVVIRGISNLSRDNYPLIIIDGEIYKGDISKLNTATISEAITLKGADASAIYGSRASNGVLVISTKGPIILPKPEEVPLVIRKNFNETAFFFPQVHADEDGFYNFEFTMPESVTEWKWKIFSHTKNAIFSLAEKTINTQLPLMVQPNMPRFLYQGDKIILQSRITNLDSANISGNSICKIEDAVTGENITSKLVNVFQQKFEVQKKSNTSIAFILNVPENILHPIKIKITASSKNFADGEEYTIPILSKKILVAEPQPFLFSKNDTSINTIKLPADAEPYCIGMHIKPKAQAALLNALPYMAFYPYGCAEQTFNKLLAHTVATTILRKDTGVQKMIAAKNVKENSKEALPTELSEQTMPWLQLNNSVALQQKNLIKILDTLKCKDAIEKYFEEILAMQNTDGGVSWFKGGQSSTYISTYLLNGFAKLKNEKQLFLADINISRCNTFLEKLSYYCNDIFLKNYKQNYIDENLMFLNAARNCQKINLIAPSIIKISDSLISAYWKKAADYTLNTQASLIQVSMQFASTNNYFSTLAKKQLESIRQLANSDEMSGLRWKELSNSDDLNTSNEEAIANIAAAFEAVGNDKATVNGIIKWLLSAKENHYWSTTKSTAEVVSLLQRNPTNVISTPITITTNMDRTTLTVTDNLLKGNTATFVQTTFPEKIQLTKDVNDLAIGGLNYYYFTALPPLNSNTNGVKISKTIYRTNNGKDEVVNENTILKIADKLKTVITIETPKQLTYVFIDEKRAASLEPLDASSGYEYSNGFSYYKSVRDAGYQFFAEKIPSGISSISYETVVAKEGSFYNGTVALQCMYFPGVKAYGNGGLLHVEQ